MIAIIIVVAIVAVVNLTGNHSETSVNSAAQQIVTLARQAETDASTQLQGESWGIHFSNVTNTHPFYALFKGASYSTSSTVETYPLPSGVAYLSSTIPSGSSLDVTFSPISGAASTSTSITIYSLANPSLASTISITSLGLVTIGTVSSTGGGNPGVGNIWVVDENGNRVQEFSPSSTASGYAYAGQLGCLSGSCTGTSTSGQFYTPMYIAADMSGNIWVSDNGNNRVEEFSPSSTSPSGYAFIRQIGCNSGFCPPNSSPSSMGTFNSTMGVAVDKSGNVWVSDEATQRVQEFNSNGTYLRQISISVNPGFDEWVPIAFDASGNLWVSDLSDDEILEYNSTTSALISNSTVPSRPFGLAFDAGGNVWVANNIAENVEEFSANGTAYSYVNQVGCLYPSSCFASSTNGMFHNPFDLAFYGNDMFVADNTNNRIEEFIPSSTASGYAYVGQIGGCVSGGCASSTANGFLWDPVGVLVR